MQLHDISVNVKSVSVYGASDQSTRTESIANDDEAGTISCRSYVPALTMPGVSTVTSCHPVDRKSVV